MSYKLDPAASLTDTVRDVARDQIDAAIETLEGASDDLEEAVHDTRKRCKKLRALLRLVRPGLGKTYGRENAAFRDLARTLSDVRDAQVLAATIDDLCEHAEDKAAVDLVAPARDWAMARREAVLRETTIGQRIDTAREKLGKARKRAARWDLAGPASEALEGGLAQTYRRARSRWQDATAEDAPELMHEWRKRVKYHWYHCRLLRRAWPDAMKVRIAALDALGDDLGTDHDLVVLVETLRAEASGIAPAALGAAEALAAARSEKLRADALERAPRLFVETPKALSRRLAGQWSVAA